MPEFWRDSVTDPPSEEEYPDGCRVLVGFSGDHCPSPRRAWNVRLNPDLCPKWAPLPTDPTVPDSELIVPKRCGSGWPRFIRWPQYCAAPSHRWTPTLEATVSLDKAPPFDPWKVAARHPMELLEDGHEDLALVLYSGGRSPMVQRRSLRLDDDECCRVAWCPLEPLLALLDKEGEG